jgi:hypothetical protein
MTASVTTAAASALVGGEPEYSAQLTAAMPLMAQSTSASL